MTSRISWLELLPANEVTTAGRCEYQTMEKKRLITPQWCDMLKEHFENILSSFHVSNSPGYTS